MKKNYQKPMMTTHNIKPVSIICCSAEAKFGNGTTGTMYSKDNYGFDNGEGDF